MNQSQWESPHVPTELADAPDIENVPAAESVHMLTQAVVAMHQDVRQVLAAVDPATILDRARAVLPAYLDLMDEAEADRSGRDAESSDDAPDSITAEASEGFATGDTVRYVGPSSAQYADHGMLYGRSYTVRDHTFRRDGVISLAGVQGMWSAIYFELVSRATDHQPTPEPEPEWKPGTVGTAEVVREGANGGPRVFRKTRGMIVHRPAPIDDDMFVTTEGEMWALEGAYCKDFVPDEPRAVWSRQGLHAALVHDDSLKVDPGTGMHYIDPDLAVERLAEYLRGESR